jgi:hypothetical protein
MEVGEGPRGTAGRTAGGLRVRVRGRARGRRRGGGDGGWRRSEVGREGKIEGKVVNVPQGWVEVWLL